MQEYRVGNDRENVLPCKNACMLGDFLQNLQDL